MNLKQRSYTKELLDGDGIPFEDIRKNMKELDFINTWLGGHGITLAGFRELLGSRQQVTVCEIGCGGGDNLAAVARWCHNNGIRVHCIGIDIKKECIDVARMQPLLRDNATWMVSDYAKAGFTDKPDIVFSSLFCHHFEEKDLQEQLIWMKENSAVGFFINDLHRHFLAYYSIKWLTRLFSSSYLVKNDAPLSVARGFQKKEWGKIFSDSGIQKIKIYWKWAFRHLIIFQHG